MNKSYLKSQLFYIIKWKNLQINEKKRTNNLKTIKINLINKKEEEREVDKKRLQVEKGN